NANQRLLTCFVVPLVPQFLQSQCAEHQVACVATEVSDNAAAERAPLAPVGWEIARSIRTLLGRPQPQVPIQRGWNRRLFGRPLRRSVAAIEPNMSFADLTNRAVPNQLHASPQAVLRASLVAHLGDYFVLRRGLA